MNPLVKSDPDILGGTPCFFGTRVPVKSLFDYLQAGDTIDCFLEQFPTVERLQAVGLLAQSRQSAEALTLSAHSS